MALTASLWTITQDYLAQLTAAARPQEPVPDAQEETPAEITPTETTAEITLTDSPAQSVPQQDEYVPSGVESSVPRQDEYVPSEVESSDETAESNPAFVWRMPDLFLTGSFQSMPAFGNLDFALQTFEEEEEPEASPDPLLPDLIPWLLWTERAEVVAHPRTRRKVLSFGATTANVGDGPLELQIGGNEEDEERPTTQVIHHGDGTKTSKPAGTHLARAWGRQHQYLYKNYGAFRLRKVGPDGEPGEVVGEGIKMGFRVTDHVRYTDPDFRGGSLESIYRGFGGTGKGQGLSVGWADHYPARLGGVIWDPQTIDVEDLEPGEYVLEIIVDPENNVLEKNEDNNVGRVNVTI